MFTVSPASVWRSCLCMTHKTSTALSSCCSLLSSCEPQFALTRSICVRARGGCSSAPVTLTAGGWTPRCAPVLGVGGREDRGQVGLRLACHVQINELHLTHISCCGCFFSQAGKRDKVLACIHLTHLYCPTMVQHYYAVPAPCKIWIKARHWCIVSPGIKAGFCSWDINSNYSLNAFDSLLVKSSLNFQV